MVRFKSRCVYLVSALLVTACGQSNQNESDLQTQQSGVTEQTSEMGLASPKVIPTGYNYEGVGFTASSRPAGAAVHRLFNPSGGNHLYTINLSELAGAFKLGYRYERVAFYAAKSGGDAVPVYRLHHPSGYHFYTASVAERSAAIWHGMKDEGIAFMAHCLGSCETTDSARTNIHRFYNGRNHFYSVTGQ